ncbi:MAG: neutral/alkaline non-lysosomal ceramidase N-terminal domain-containing protein [Myxococcales bacterium]|nr:neutral/alkaline non-lysosomal ceramidase N-terminal domain-containing protein [Myxococcales bacterium]
MTVEVSTPAPRRAPGQLLAGAARVDITPPPGYPMGGHSFARTSARGAWGRLYARALVFVDPRGQPLALVVGDLWAVSSGLTDAVIERLQTKHGLENFDRGSVIVSATHTHHSPAAFASDFAHNFAAAEVASFDRELFDAIAGGLAEAIAEAYVRREPAILRRVAAPVPGFSRNRSLPAFRADPEAAAWIAATPGPGLCAGPAGTEAEACRAIDPTVFALRLEARRDRRLLGAAIFAAAHPTAMANVTPVYHGDTFGVAAARLEEELGGGAATGPVIAIFNGAEGDVSPAWRAQGYREALRVAGILGEGIRYLLEAPASAVAVGSIRERHGLFTLAGREFVDPWGERRRTGKHAWMGWPAANGAEDGPTGARVPPEGSTRRRPTSDGHGLKKKMLLIADAFLPPEVPLAVVRLGDELLVTLPGEVTTIMGARIRDAVARSADTAPAQVHLIGLANTYRSYFTTPEEYDQQHYEGASTIYGRDSGHALASDLACLAAPTGPCDGRLAPEAMRYRPGQERLHSAVDRSRSRRWWQAGFDAVALIFDRRGAAPVALRFDTPVPAAGAIGDAVWPRLDVELRSRGAWLPWVGAAGRESDRLHRFVTIVREDLGDRWRWEARWLDPAALPAGIPARIRVRIDGRSLGCSATLERSDLVAGEAIELSFATCEGEAATE